MLHKNRNINSDSCSERLDHYIAWHCEETADGNEWTNCALKLDDRSTITHRGKWWYCARGGCKWGEAIMIGAF